MVDEMEQVIVKEQPDGTYVALRPHLLGAYIIGRGKTWLEALGDLAIQDIHRFKIQARVERKDGTPATREFFGPQYDRDH